MKAKSKGILNFILAFIFVLSVCFSLFTLIPANNPVSAENQLSYKKKIVAVLYDNSTSMNNKDGRDPLARYSLQMLTSLLSSDDELHIVPMNSDPLEYGGAPRDEFEINLKENLEYQIEHEILRNTSLKPSGGTPIDSIANTVEVLKGLGMKTTQELGSQIQNEEFWLVILTDGEFTGYSGNVKGVADVIAGYIDGYAGLNTIFLGFGEARDLSGTTLDNYPFSSYVATNENLSEKMNQVANKISGRYGAETSDYTINGNKITVDLDKYDFAMSSVSVIAQDCNAKLTSVTYKGNPITPTQEIELSTQYLKDNYNKNYGYNQDFSIDGGYTVVLRNAEQFSGGVIELTYDKSVSNVSVLLEPAIRIEVYLEYFDGNSWKTTDMQYINSNMFPDDKIRVQYKVFSSDNVEIDTKAIFGKHYEKVTYCGTGYAIGEEIPLKEGINELFVSVSVLDGAYTMCSSLMCYVEKDPTYYRIDAELKQGTGNDYKKAEIDFKVFVSNVKVDYDALTNDYKWSVTAEGPDGKTVDVTSYVDSNGVINADFDGTNLGFGEYKVTCTVLNKQSNVSRTTEKRFSLVPRSIEVNCLTTEPFSVTAYRLGAVTKTIEFEVILDGINETFENEIITYSVSVGGSDVTDKTTIENGKLVFVIDDNNIADTSLGKKQVKVTVKTLGDKSDQAVYDFEIVKSSYRVEKLDKGASEFSRYDISEANAGAFFTVYKDDQQLTITEINQAMDSGEIKVDTNPGGWITILPAAAEITVETIDGQAVICCRIFSDVMKPFDNLLGSFIFANQKDVTVNYNTASATKTFTITPVSMATRIIRWVIILLIILFILHVVLFLLGFIIAKPLPRGVLLKFDVADDDLGEVVGKVKVKPLNMKNERLLWHLSRFIPFRELANQKDVTLLEYNFGVDKKSRTVAVKVKCRPKIVLVDYTDTIIPNKDGTEILNLISSYKKGVLSSKKLEIKNRVFLRFFRKMPSAPYKTGEKLGSYTGWYGVHKVTDNNKIGNLTGMRVFVPARKSKTK